jgi:hypothetical protein
MSKIAKWKNWCLRIEGEILTPYKFDKLIAEEYFKIIKPVLDDGAPADFHNWCNNNYGLALAMIIRKLSDEDPRVYSIRKLVGDIANNNSVIKKTGYVRRYPRHLRDLAEQNWNNRISSVDDVLPKSIPSAHIDEIKLITRKVNVITNRFLTHTNRSRNKKYSVSFDEMYSIVRRLIEIGYFYSDLVSGKISDDDSNVSINYDWIDIFKKPWIK